MIDNRVLCVHGGISPDLHSLSQLREIKRPMEIPETGLECDLVWADPVSKCEQWGESSRGVSCVFGEQATRGMLQALGIDAVFRAHEVCAKGHDFPFDPWTGVVTIFSATNYGGQFGNNGAVVSMNEESQCRFITFEPIHASLAGQIKRPPRSDEVAVDGKSEEGDVAVRRFGN